MEVLGYKRRKPAGCFTFLVLALALPVLFFFGSDQICGYDIYRRLPFYPEATIMQAEHNSFRPRGLGKTEMVFSTPDDYETVAEWYRQLNLEQLDKNIYNGLASINRWAEKDPEGNGTLIYYVTECGM